MSNGQGEGSKRYNGWTNYETWAVNLWLTNEEGSYRYWRDEAKRHRKESRGDASNSLADQLKSELEEASPLEAASLFSDLLNAALAEVDWHEVADAFLEEVEPEPEDEETDQDEEEAYSPEDFENARKERTESIAGPLFELGQLVSTPGALEALTPEELMNAIGRHLRGDWGDVGRHDWRANEEALSEGFRLLSVYRTEKGAKFWVITEADRSVTTVLLPEEY